MFPKSKKRKANGGNQIHSEHPQHKIDETQPGAPGHGIPFLQATLFACVLEDCITQMDILAECNNELRILKTQMDIGRLLALKFHVKQGEHTEDLDKINKKNLGSNQYKLNKLFADRTFFSDVLQQAYLDMALNGCFSSVTASIKRIEDRNEYRAKLTEEESKNKITRRELVKNLRQQRNHIKSVIYDTELTIQKLKCQGEETELNTETRSRFVDNWQRARSEQNTQSILNMESGPSDAIEYFHNRSDQEQRVHSEVELLVNIFVNETLTKVEHWMNKFDIDMEEQDLKIAKMKNRLQDTSNRRLMLEKTYETHEVLVKNWLQFKKERQEALEYREKMTWSAHVVQAWWRGLLVRLQMGPYKPKRRQKSAVDPAGKDKKKKKK